MNSTAEQRTPAPSYHAYKAMQLQSSQAVEDYLAKGGKVTVVPMDSGRFKELAKHASTMIKRREESWRTAQRKKKRKLRDMQHKVIELVMKSGTIDMPDRHMKGSLCHIRKMLDKTSDRSIQAFYSAEDAEKLIKLREVLDERV